MTMDGIKTPMGTLRPGMIAANLGILGTLEDGNSSAFWFQKTQKKLSSRFFSWIFIYFYWKQNTYTDLKRWLPLNSLGIDSHDIMF